MSNFGFPNVDAMLEQLTALDFAGLSAHDKFMEKVRMTVFQYIDEVGGLDEAKRLHEEVLNRGRATKQYKKAMK